MEIVNRDGIDALTIAGLARELSIQPPSLYNHLKGLDDLRRAVVLRAMRQLREELRNVAMGLAREGALRAIAHAYRRFAKRVPGLYLMMQSAGDKKDSDVSEIAHDTAQVVASVLKGYGIVGDDALHVVRVFRSALHGFVSLEISGGFGLPLSLDHSYACLLNVLDLGLEHWADNVRPAQPVKPDQENS
jgi:AcrR family transcriptional regulator